MSKHCPVCKKGSMRLETDFDNKADGYHIIYAKCSLCGARTASLPTMVQAQNAWEQEQITNCEMYQTNIFELMGVK